MTEERLARFGTWTDIKGMVVTGTRPFFAGPHADERMRMVRVAISEIRMNWNRYDEFMADLRSYMGDGSTIRDDAYKSRREALFRSVKRWGEQTDDYSALRLYTSQLGYAE